MTHANAQATPALPVKSPRTPEERIYRHRLLTRITHWINAICITMLLMSGMEILNAHPRLYWGQFGANADAAFIELKAVDDGHGGQAGMTRVGSFTFRTTGLLGESREDGQWTERGFPAWLTLPGYQDLATGRRWHFFIAWAFVINGLTYLTFGLVSGHFRRDLAPRRSELAPRHILRDIWDHVRLKHPSGDAAKRYNTLQKVTYIAVIFVILPIMVLTGLTMSPGVDAVMPVLLSLFGGRQSARTIHFITANLIVFFVIVHVVEVFIAGVWNEMRSIITGWYLVRSGEHDEQS